jgi:uncharacterized protein YggE
LLRRLAKPRQRGYVGYSLLAGRTRNRPLRASAAAIAVLAIAAPGAFAAPEALAQDRTVDVVGDASVTARNDTADVSFHVTTRAKKASVALAHNSARMRSVIAAIKARGIPANDIRTDQVSLSQIRVKISKRHHRRIYRAANGVRVTIRQVAKTGAVITAAVDAGATGFGNVDLSYSKADELYRQALGDAFDEAKAKAQTLSDHAGATLGDALHISEGFDQFESDVRAPSQSATGSSTVTPVQPGTTTVFAEVSVTFALE